MDRQDGQDFLGFWIPVFTGMTVAGRDERQGLDSVVGWWMTPVAGGIIMAVR